MDPNVRATLLWGAVAVLLVAALAAIVFCQATEGILKAHSCETVLNTFHRLTSLVWR